MSKDTSIPNPKEATAAEPLVLLSAQKVLKIYNATTNKDTDEVTMKVKEWFIAAALQAGWKTAKFNRDQCLLSIQAAGEPAKTVTGNNNSAGFAGKLDVSMTEVGGYLNKPKSGDAVLDKKVKELLNLGVHAEVSRGTIYVDPIDVPKIDAHRRALARGNS